MRKKTGFMTGEKGQILIWVIALMILAALVIPPFVAMAYSNLHTSSVRQERMQELYAADTGIEDALNWIISEGNNITITKPSNPTLPAGNWSDESTAEYTLDDTINNCQVDITVARDLRPGRGNYTYCVYATATNKDNRAHVTVQVYVSPTGDWTSWSTQEGPQVPKPQGNVSNNPFSYSMGSLQDASVLNLKQGDVTGDVYANGPLNLLGGNNIIDGNVYSVGDLRLEEAGVITGNASATGNIYLYNTSSIGENAWGNQSITVGSTGGIGMSAKGGNAYAQTNIVVSSGYINGSAWANHDVNVGNVAGTIKQSAFANNNINVLPGGKILGWAEYLNSLTPNPPLAGSVGNYSKLSQAVLVPEPIMPQFSSASEAAAKAQATYYGNATSTGNITTDNVTIKSNQSKYLGPCVINSLDVKGTLTLTGTVYVKGTITLENNAVVTTGSTTPSTPAVLVAEGDINIDSNIVAQPDQAMPLLMSVYGNIYVGSNADIYGALYAPAPAPNGVVYIKNGAYVDGAIVAQQIVGTGGAAKQYNVVYNPIVQNIPGLPYATIPVQEPPAWEPTEEDVSSTQPFGVNVDSYIVIE
jgi:cytoskeletal protein CcmA (bactofilin family)